MIPPLAICQMRLHSTRLPEKMLLPLGGKPLWRWAYDVAIHTFGSDNVVCAIPASDVDGPLGDSLREHGAEIFTYDGDENDVLGRFMACAHRYRWHPDSVIVRVTCDDPFKRVDALYRVSRGERLPVELGGEAFTLEMLDSAHLNWEGRAREREHITYALFAYSPPLPPKGLWTIDTPEDYALVIHLMNEWRHAGHMPDPQMGELHYES